MPGVAHLIEVETTSGSNFIPESETLYLPSSLNPSIRESCCVPGLPATECRIRLGQADDALNEVRRQLRITSSIIQFKRGQHQASQQLSRKSRALMAKFTNKTHLAAERYIAARAALSALDPFGDWTERLQPLNMSKDLHLPRREENDGLDEEDLQLRHRGSKFRGRKQSENQRELSWIWRAQHLGSRPSKVTSIDEVNESKSASHATLWLLTFSCCQRCRLNGRRPKHVPIAGMKNSFWLLKKCDAYSPFLNGKLIYGPFVQTSVLMFRLHSEVVCAHMRTNKQPVTIPLPSHSLASGTPSWSTTPFLLSGLRSIFLFNYTVYHVPAIYTDFWMNIGWYWLF